MVDSQMKKTSNLKVSFINRNIKLKFFSIGLGPMLFKLFCGCKEDIQIRFNSSDISIGISGMEGTCEMVLQGLSDCISPTFHDKWVLKLSPPSPMIFLLTIAD